MRFEPVFSPAGVDDDRDIVEREGIFHGIDHERWHEVRFVIGHLEDEFIVDLEEHAGAKAAFAEGGGGCGPSRV